jgi:hypothetical protein
MEALPSKTAKCPGVELLHGLSNQQRDFIPPPVITETTRNAGEDVWREEPSCSRWECAAPVEQYGTPPPTLTLAVLSEPATRLRVIYHKDTRTSKFTAALTQEVPTASSQPYLACLALPSLPPSRPTPLLTLTTLPLLSLLKQSLQNTKSIVLCPESTSGFTSNVIQKSIFLLKITKY